MRRKDFFEEKRLKSLIYFFTFTLIISVVAFVFIFVMYNKKLKSDASKNISNLSSLKAVVSNDELESLSQVEETSISEDKGINETSKETANTVSENKKSSNQNKTEKNKVKEKEKSTENTENTQDNQISAENTTNIENTTTNQETPIVEKELEFMVPVSGEISKDFAMDTLVFSNTLEEWTTHSGIDISAEKTSIVVASEEGTVESIKNDPRYGLTVIISHPNGFSTMYSNLLTSEFVSEGQTVEKGQTIGTIGESASFEIAEQPHLHFEMYKDGECVNPTIYLK